MRRGFLVLVAFSVALTAFPPAPSDARSLLSFLGLRIGGRHHAHHHYGRHHARWARSHARVASASVRPVDNSASVRPPDSSASVRPADSSASVRPADSDARASGSGDRRVATSVVSLYWPRAYDDLVGATLVTAVSDKDRFWNHGVNDIFAGIFAPADAGQPVNARRRAGAKGSQEVAASEACNPASASDDAEADGTGAAPAMQANGPGAIAFKKIEQRLAPTPEQQAAFDELRAAMIKAERRINSGCWPPYASGSPPERLKAIGDRLWALRQAMLMLRTPLEKVYSSLSDAQKAALNGKAGPAKITCATDLSGLSWPRDQIEQAIQPNDDQRANLETLQFVTLQMGQAIAYSCPSQPLTGPVERLDAIGDRLNTILYANMIISRTFGNFYASLTDEQKAGLRAVGRSLGQPGANRRAADAAAKSR
jgi:hypothetical protein